MVKKKHGQQLGSFCKESSEYLEYLLKNLNAIG